VQKTDESWLMHTPNVDRGALKNFKAERLKLGLKFGLWTLISLGILEIISQNFTTRRAGRQAW